MDTARLVVILAILIQSYLVINSKPTKKINKGCDKTIRTTRMVRSPRVTSANRGQPVNCVYRLVKYGVGDLVFELNFRAFHVGVPHNASTCSGGYLAIVDDPGRINTSGHFCGRLQHSRTFLAETEHSLSLVFHAVSFTRQVYFRVQASVLPKRLAQERHKELVLDNPGHRVAHTYCDRQYVNCQGFCDVASPRYPGFYPRNATCLYRITFNETEDARVVLGGQYYDHFDVWGGPWSTSRCHSNYCSSGEITTQCSYDYVRIYDVSTSIVTPVPIQKFCGRGHLPRIVSRGQEILLEFVSAAAGSIANDGFHLSIGTESRMASAHGEMSPEGECRWIFDSRIAGQGQIRSLRHWYAPNTRCSYRFVGQPGQRVFLHFVNFNANRDEACRSKLTLYDATGPDGSHARGVHCGKRQPNETLLSSSEHFYIEFDSKLGSYDGSNFEYSVLYTFVHDVREDESGCDQTFASDENSPAKKGTFDFFRNRLHLRRRHVACTLRFVGRPTERVRIAFTRLQFDPTKHCSGQQKLRCTEGGLIPQPVVAAASSFDSLVFVDARQKVQDCLCGALYLPYEITSSDAYLEIRLRLHDLPKLAYRDLDAYTFRGSYEFLQVGCGKSRLSGQQGELVFPAIAHHLLPTSVRCRWTIEVRKATQVLLKFSYLHLPGNCSTDLLAVSGAPWSDAEAEVLCRDHYVKLELVVPATSPGANSLNSKIVLQLNASSTARFKLLWTEVTSMMRVTEEAATSEVESVEDAACEYLCRGGTYCISKALVCNGVINCPATNFTWHPLDEAITECASFGVILQWVLLTFSSSFAVVLLIGVLVIYRKKYCTGSEST